jgi:hypothetical protein
MFLVVRADYFDICSSKNSLTYCFYPLPIVETLQREAIVKQEFEDVMARVRERLKLCSERVYVYLKDGTTITSH